MTQSLHYSSPRETLTDTIMAAKIRKNLTFEAINQGTGLSLAFVTAALLGQHPLPEQAARVVAAKLDLDEDAIRLLQTIRCAAASQAVCRPIQPFIAFMKWCKFTAPR